MISSGGSEIEVIQWKELQAPNYHERHKHSFFSLRSQQCDLEPQGPKAFRTDTEKPMHAKRQLKTDITWAPMSSENKTHGTECDGNRTDGCVRTPTCTAICVERHCNSESPRSRGFHIPVVQGCCWESCVAYTYKLNSQTARPTPTLTGTDCAQPGQALSADRCEGECKHNSLEGSRQL